MLMYSGVWVINNVPDSRYWQEKIIVVMKARYELIDGAADKWLSNKILIVIWNSDTIRRQLF